MSLVRFLSSGEDGGPDVTVVVEGLPSGLLVDDERLAARVARHGVAVRLVDVDGGCRGGRTTGGPLSLRLAADQPLPTGRDGIPRPGTGELSGMLKYGFTEARPATTLPGMQTVGRVAAGTLAAWFLEACDVRVIAHVIRIGSTSAPTGARPGPDDEHALDLSPVRCLDPDAAAEMEAQVQQAAAGGDSLGGSFEVIAYGFPAGLGSHVHWDRRLDGLLAGALMSIPGVRMVELGDGLEMAAQKGRGSRDGIGWLENVGYLRTTNRAGGIEGGMSTGEPIVLRGGVAPAPVGGCARTVDVVTKREIELVDDGADPCVVPRTGLVAGAMASVVLASELLRKTGGDTIEEVRHSLSTYRRMLRWS
jgi:chorismate synthase